MEQITSLEPADLARRLAARADLVLVDVREPKEWSLCRIEGSVHIPLGELARRHVELDPLRPTVCICHHGVRSANAAAMLQRLDFRELYNLAGGIDRWAIDVDRALRRY